MQTRRDFLMTAMLFGSVGLPAIDEDGTLERIHTRQVSGQDAPAMVLNGLEIRIDPGTGALLSLVYPQVGTILETDATSAGLLDLAYPVEEFPPLRLATRFSKAQIQNTVDGMTVHWETLGSSRPEFPLPSGKVSARVTFRPAMDRRSVIVSCRIENHSRAPVPQVIFPDLVGLKPFAGMEDTQLRFPRGVVRPFTTPAKPTGSVPPFYDRGWAQYSPSGYYDLNALRWLDYGSFQGGLSVFERKWGTRDAPGVITFRSEAFPNAIRLLWEHRVTIAPGQIWDSGEFWLTPHVGGWAKGIEVYRSYVREVYPPRALPSHVRDGIGFQSIWMTPEFERDPGRAYFRFADLPRVAADAREHGIDELVPWAIWTQTPIEMRRNLGSEQDFFEAIRRAKEIGVNIAPFTSFQTAFLESSLKRYGVKPESVDNWTYSAEFIPMFRPYYSRIFAGGWIDSGNRLWQEDISEQLTKWIERGLYSFGWDQFSNRTADDRDAGFLALIEQIRRIALAKDPESTFSGESITRQSLEEDGAVLDYTWNWVDYVDAGPILNVLRSPRLNCNVEDSPLIVKKGFCDGLYLNVIPKKPDLPNGSALISDRPELATALKRIARLRKQFLTHFVEGAFLGDSLLSEPSPAFVRGYQLGGSLLVFVLNDQSQPRILRTHSNLNWWLPSAGSYRVKSYSENGHLSATSHTSGTNWVGVTGLLNPSELAIFEIEVA
jgi:hypothetical protein